MKRKRNHVTVDQVAHIAKLANIPVAADKQEMLANAFSETLDVVDELKAVDVSSVRKVKYQVTGLINVLREDVVDETRTFTQKEALANAKNTLDGYFVVDGLLANKDT